MMATVRMREGQGTTVGGWGRGWLGALVSVREDIFELGEVDCLRFESEAMLRFGR